MHKYDKLEVFLKLFVSYEGRMYYVQNSKVGMYVLLIKIF